MFHPELGGGSVAFYGDRSVYRIHLDFDCVATSMRVSQRSQGIGARDLSTTVMLPLPLILGPLPASNFSDLTGVGFSAL